MHSHSKQEELSLSKLLNPPKIVLYVDCAVFLRWWTPYAAMPQIWREMPSACRTSSNDNPCQESAEGSLLCTGRLSSVLAIPVAGNAPGRRLAARTCGRLSQTKGSGSRGMTFLTF